MSDIRFNQWLHQSGTGGVSQVASGAVGVGTTNPLADFYVRGDAQITGILTAGHIAMGSSITFGDGDRAYFGDGTDMQLYHNGTNSYIENGTNALNIKSYQTFLQNANGSEDYLKATDGYGVELYHNNNKRIETTGVGVTVFGTTQTQQLNVSGISTFSDEVKLTTDNKGIIFGQSSDLSMKHDGTNSYILNNTGSFIISADTIQFNNRANNKTLAKFTNGVDAQLYYDGDIVAQTTQYGFQITDGALDLNNTGGSGASIRCQSVGPFYVGAAAQGDLVLYCQDNTNNSVILQANTGEKYVECNMGGSVDIYHHGNKKIETTDTGAVVTGIVTTSGTVDVKGTQSVDNVSLQLSFSAPEGHIKTKNTSGSPASNLALHTTDTSGNTNRVMHLRYDGKVGIGTNVPETKCHIYDASADPYLKIGGSGRDCGIQLDAANSFVAMRTDAASRLWINAKYDGIYFTTGGTTASNQRLKIDTSGNLTLKGGIIYGNTNASNVLKLQSTSGNGNHSRIEIGASQSSDNGGIHFYTAGSSTATRHMTLKGTSGNLGLSVDNPDTKLHIVHANADEDVLKIEAKPVTAGTGAKSKIAFQITQSNNQSARLAEIVSHAENGWGGQLSFNVKQTNSTPNNTVEEALRIASSDSAATNLKMVVDAYLQMGGYNNTNESFANLATLFSARDMSGSAMVSGQTDTISGYARRRITSDGSGTFFFGPYGAFPAGDYTALFRLKVSDRSGSSGIGYIDIIGNGIGIQGRNTAPRSSDVRMDLQTNDFTASNTYQYFALDFSKSNSAANIECRFLSYAANTDVYLDHVLILPRLNHGVEGVSGMFDY